MLVESSQLPEGDIATDICLIGSGPAALTIAQSLGRAHDMWLLEAGSDDASEASKALYRGRNIGLPYFDLDGCRSRQFGGSANCWGGFCRIFDEHDFDARPRIPHSGWPFRRADLLPHLERAHALCGLGSLDYSYDAWREASGQGPSPFHGTYVTPEIRQKASMDVAGLKRELIASPRVTVCLNANVVELVTDADGRQVTRVEFCDPTGRRLAVRARLVVLAAGGIENPRLLLASARVQKTGVGNTHDLVGRFFMEHVDIEAGVFRPVTRDLFRQQLAWKRAGSIYVRNSLAISEQIRRDEQLLRCFFHIGDLTVDHTWAYRSAAHIVEQLRRGRPVYNFRYHLQNLIWERVPLLAAAKWRLHLTREIPGASGRPGLLPLRLTVEPSPSFASRVTLARERDPFGVPRVALDWRINDDDTAHATRSIELFAADMQALGLGEVLAEPPSRWARRGTYHHMGTTRMSDDPTRGVVDANCRVHGVGNLFVAGSSVFPTAGTGTPTLMLVALASRLAEHLGPQVARAPMPGGSWAA